MKNHEILIEDGFIVDLGTQVGKAEIEFDASGRLLTPSFIDSHTHPILAIEVNEFNQRLKMESRIKVLLTLEVVSFLQLIMLEIVLKMNCSNIPCPI